MALFFSFATGMYKCIKKQNLEMGGEKDGKNIGEKGRERPVKGRGSSSRIQHRLLTFPTTLSLPFSLCL